MQQSKLFAKNTICITIAANIGKVAILSYDSCFPDSVVGLTTDEKIVINMCITIYLRNKKN